MKIEGCCHCGKISYEAEINPDYVIICHCTDCQTISGSPYRVTVPVKTENFKLRGQPKTYVKTAASGNKRVLAFCADCGSAIYSTSLEDPRVFTLRDGYRPYSADTRPDPLAARDWHQRTNRAGLAMSVVRGRPEAPGR